MSTSLNQLVDTIRNAALVPRAQVNYGVTDGLTPPYISVGEWKWTWLRDTQNGVRVSTFSVLTVAKTVEEAVSLADSLDDLLTNNYNATDQDIGLLQEGGEVGQVDPPNLYQYGVKMTYTLSEDPNIG